MPIAAAVVGIGGSLLAASSQKSAAKKASKAQVASDAAAIAEQRRQYDQTRGDLMPWQEAGQSALSGQGDLLGLNGGDKQSASIEALKASPLYASLFGNGQEALLSNASATGGLRGGNTQGALANFGRDTLAGVIESQLSNLSGVSAQGQNAASQTGAFGQASANSISALLQDQGAARAGSALAVGAANTGMINNISSSLGALSRLF